MVSLGAGLYEELVFRVLLVSGLAALGAKVFGMKPVPSGIMAAILGALIFPPSTTSDPMAIHSRSGRSPSGRSRLVFSTLYLTRGFGIAAWSHALYDVFLTL
jgi:hypothetical protein